MKLRELWKTGSDSLSECEIENAETEARYLLEWATGKCYSELLLHPEEEAAEEEAAAYEAAIGRRRAHVPLQYITGEQEFMGYPFYVNRHVLIPRQDTEVLTELAYRHIRERYTGEELRVLDLCSGSGCIGISLYRLLEEALPDNRIRITLSDISPDALHLSLRNQARHRASVEIVESDLFDHLRCRRGRFHVIVSNPPYIPSREIETLMPEVRDYEPRIALDGAEDGLACYRRIAAQAGAYLERGGGLFLEIGCRQAAAVLKLLSAAGYEQLEVRKDLAGLDRVISGVWNG